MTPIARTKWEEVYSGAILGPWDQGAAVGEAVQPGVWNGRGIVIRYRLPPDFETRFNKAMARGEEEQYLLSLVADVGYAEEEE